MGLFLVASLCKPGDAFYIYFARDKELSDTVFVEEDTTVFVPIAGQLNLGGLDKRKAAEAIQKALDTLYSLPLVKVYPLKRIYVTGQVSRPGAFYLLPGDDFLKAVSLAGPSQRADLARVKVVRGSKTLGIDLRKPSSIKPQDGDVVVVPRCWWPTLQQLYYLLAGAAVLVSLYLTLGGAQ